VADDPDDLASVIDELYAGDPSGFTARRDEIAAGARRRGDRALAVSVKALRRPSAAAYAVNLLARHQPEELAQLVALGEQLRLAQQNLSADDLRLLGKQRSRLVAQMGRQAAALVRSNGSSISATAVREVESTLEAALGHSAASEAVISGRLVRALERSGLDEVDLDGAVAGPHQPAAGGGHRPAAPRHTPAPRVAAPSPAGGGQHTGAPVWPAVDSALREAAEVDLVRARRRREEVDDLVKEAGEAARSARSALSTAVGEREAADRQVEELVRRLAEARHAADAAAEEERRTRRATADADAGVEQARAAAERAEVESRRAESRLRDLGTPAGS
jgi:hypothetical protein